MSPEEDKGNERSSVEGKEEGYAIFQDWDLSLNCLSLHFLVAFLQKLFGEQGWYEYERSKASNLLV